MARRKEYSFNPIDFDDDVAVGILLPFGKNKGLFTLSYTTEDQAISNLKNLLLTRKGERLMQPDFGSSVFSLIFDQMDADLEDRLQLSVTEDIEFWLPYIVLDAVEVTSDFDRNRVKIEIFFRVTESGANRQIIVFVDTEGSIDIQ